MGGGGGLTRGGGVDDNVCLDAVFFVVVSCVFWCTAALLQQHRALSELTRITNDYSGSCR